jgi:hypothetical protein
MDFLFKQLVRSKYFLIGLFILSALVSIALFVPRDNDPLFKSLTKPIIAEAQRRRAERAPSDPGFAKRVDAKLNASRVNVLLYGYGETHEPPVTERAIIGSYTIISYDTRDGTVSLISMTHDIRAPEVEREMVKRGTPTHALKMDRAYEIGGFPLMREMLENATGLSIDFEIAFQDSAIQRVVDNVFGGIQVEVPVAFEAQPFYLDGVKYPKGFFPQGKQILNGRQVIQFIKTVPVAEGLYDPVLEHNARKHLVFAGLLDSLKTQSGDRDFWLRAMTYARGELASGGIAMDFDPSALIVNNIGAMLGNLDKLISQRSSGFPMPAIERTTYIVDPAQGDGGVQWVNANAAVNPITRRDIDARVYPNLDYEVPIDANPYGDLPSEYWTSVRTLVRKLVNGEPLRNSQE